MKPRPCQKATQPAPFHHSEMDAEFMGLRARQHLINGKQPVEPFRAEPLLFLDQIPLDHRDLCDRPAQASRPKRRKRREDCRQRSAALQPGSSFFGHVGVAQPLGDHRIGLILLRRLSPDRRNSRRRSKALGRWLPRHADAAERGVGRGAVGRLVPVDDARADIRPEAIVERRILGQRRSPPGRSACCWPRRSPRRNP